MEPVIPFKCPVCNGSGVSPFRVLGNDATKPCISCQGHGVIWGPPREDSELEMEECPNIGATGMIKFKHKKVLLEE